mmetsp:Transcript_7415/g.7499  ORF Transcript_7415/g.7499 Transcript_7415/m.7499 type:complete len:130 (-) Transcript_7415:977-1366(-)
MIREGSGLEVASMMRLSLLDFAGRFTLTFDRSLSALLVIKLKGSLALSNTSEGIEGCMEWVRVQPWVVIFSGFPAILAEEDEEGDGCSIKGFFRRSFNSPLMMLVDSMIACAKKLAFNSICPSVSRRSF